MSTRTPTPPKTGQDMTRNATTTAATTGKMPPDNKTAINTADGKPSKPMQANPVNKTKWPQQMKSAKIQWNKLSEAELLKVDGDPQQLAALIQKHYGLSPDVAKEQAKSFMQKQYA